MKLFKFCDICDEADDVISLRFAQLMIFNHFVFSA